MKYLEKDFGYFVNYKQNFIIVKEITYNRGTGEELKIPNKIFFRTTI